MTTLLIDVYYVNEFLKNVSIIPYSTDCDKKFSEKIVIIHISCATIHFEKDSAKFHMKFCNRNISKIYTRAIIPSLIQYKSIKLIIK